MNLTIIIPEWFLYVVVALCFLYLVNTVGGLYLFYLKLKLSGFSLSDRAKTLLSGIAFILSCVLLYNVGF